MFFVPEGQNFSLSSVRFPSSSYLATVHLLCGYFTLPKREVKDPDKEKSTGTYSAVVDFFFFFISVVSLLL